MMDKVVKCGQILTWEVRFGGEPFPEVKWFYNDKQLRADDR